MKKILLLSSFVALASVAATAEFIEPSVYENGGFCGFSPNGQYTAAQCYGTVIIVDVKNGVHYSYEVSDFNEYSIGNGNSFSNTGIIVGSTTPIVDAAYWENGEWHQLPTSQYEGLNNLTNGITPDGSRICGTIGLEPVSLDTDNTMQIPVVWERKEDGTYSEPIRLPYPEKDFTNRAPQYATALCISDDGKTIVGQVTDCSGFFQFPIAYIEDAEGKWTYKYLCYNKIIPEGTVVEYPGDYPEGPDASDYMTEAEQAAYQAAYQEWVMGGYQGDMPEESSFMTAEEKAAYDQAKAEHDAKVDEWTPKSEAFYDTLAGLLDNAPAFEFNDVHITPNGKTYISSDGVNMSEPGSWFPEMHYTPWLIDIETEDVTKLNFDKSMSINSVANDNVYFACNGQGNIPMTGYIIENGKYTDLYDFLSAKSPEMKEWVEQFLIELVPDYEMDENGDFIEVNKEYKYTGMTYASADLGQMAFWNDCPSDYNLYAKGYLCDLSQFSGVKDVISAGKNTIKFDKEGNLIVDGDIKNMSVYDLSGREILTTAKPQGIVSSKLSSGIYIVKAHTTDGASFSAKIAK